MNGEMQGSSARRRAGGGGAGAESGAPSESVEPAGGDWVEALGGGRGDGGSGAGAVPVDFAGRAASDVLVEVGYDPEATLADGALEGCWDG